MTIVTRQAVLEAFERARKLGASEVEAAQTVAQSLCLPFEAVAAVVLEDEAEAA
jgi:hypothetical protein